MSFLYFLDSVYPLSKCITLAQAKSQPVVASFYVKSIPGNIRREDEITALTAELEHLEASVDTEAYDPKTNALIGEYQTRLNKIEHTVQRELHLLNGYARQWKSPNALKQYSDIATFLVMPVDIEDTSQANYIATEFGITRIPCLCGITPSGILTRSQRRLPPNEFAEWMDGFLSKCNVRL